jgi:serine/threonine protein kinase
VIAPHIRARGLVGSADIVRRVNRLPVKQPIPFGKYYLLERVNVGGMAEVYKAKATGVEGFERMVAVKRILPSIAEDEEFILMFVDEAKIAVQLTHANIAQIFDLGKVDESYFIALEYIHGKDLRAIFNRGRSRNERVPVAMACYAIMKLCEGLDYAHNKRDAFGQFLNLVHRDVSPQNILVSYDGEVKIIDFGIAKAAGKAGKTQAGILKGKFGYMSPEQVQGLEVDRRSDVFGVGIVLYELLTGERLFVAETDFATLEKVRKVDIVPPSHFNRQIPEELEQIVLKALARDRDQRHQTAMQLHDELQAFMYASGNFFARRDLSLYMHRVFAEEIQKESARDKEYSDTGSNAQGRVLEDVTGLTAFDEIEPVSTVSALHASSPSMQPHHQPRHSGRERLSTPGGMMMPGGGMESHGPRPHKSTLLGLPSAAMPQGATPRVMQPQAAPTPRVSVPPLVPRANSIPPGHMHAAQTPPVMGGAAAGDQHHGGAMEWDDEEMSTQIYDRPDDSQSHQLPGGMAQAPVSGSFPPVLQGGAQTSPGGYAPAQPVYAEPPQQVAYGAPSPFTHQTQPGGYGAPAQHTYEPEPAAAPRQRNPMVMAVVLVLLIVSAIVGALLLVRPKAPGTVHVTTSPNDAVVSIDGRPVAGSSPFIVTDVAPGTIHEVSVTKAGYRSWSTKLQLQASETMELPAVTLEALESGFQLDSTPSGASVFVDGKQLDQVTPVRVTNLTPGDHQIRLSIDGFAPWESSLHVTPGSVLELPRAQLTARTPDTVQPQAQQPVPQARPEPSEPRAPPEPRAPRRRPSTMPEPPEPRQPSVTPNADPPAVAGGNGTLRVNTRPWSQVFVDGRLIGNTPQMNIPVSSGSHTVMFVNDEFGLRKTIKVSVKPGETVTKSLTLTE